MGRSEAHIFAVLTLVCACSGPQETGGQTPSLCPGETEDVDGFEDSDGCPDPDNDRDQIMDAEDACPCLAEDRDGFEDEDGCPEPDDDADGIPDECDLCPHEPETLNGVVDDDGCPDVAAVRIAIGNIEVVQYPQFERNSSDLRAADEELLQNIVEVLEEHPEIELVIVEGHTSGDERRPDALSQARAEAVVDYLVNHGVEPARLLARSFGAGRPLTGVPMDRSRNRRVAFEIERIAPRQEALAAQDPADNPSPVCEPAVPVPVC